MFSKLKIFWITAGFSLNMFFAHAQVATLEDSLSSISPGFYKSLQTERAKGNRSDSLYWILSNRERLQFLQSNPVQLVFDTLKQAGLIEMHYKNTEKNIRLPVEAYRTYTAAFYTEGFTTVGKAKIQGRFYFDKIWEDSLANNLSESLQPGTPFTHFAAKAGNYERQNIRFEAGLGLPLAGGFQMTSLLNYDYHWSSGSVDPRPENKIFQIKYTPGLAYKYKNTILGAGYMIGKTDGAYDILYKNEMFRTSQLYPDRRLYINNGYGYIGQYTSEAYSKSKDKIDGWIINMATHISNWWVKGNYSNSFFAKRNFILSTNKDSLNNPIQEQVHSKYELLVKKLEALIYNENQKRVHQISFNGSINEGTAVLMSSSNGANYLYDGHNALLDYLLSLKNFGKVLVELGFNGMFNHFKKKDFLAMHFYEHTRADFSLYAGKYFYGAKHNFKINVKSGLMLPLKNDLSVPLTQVNVFTGNITYPEYDFRGSTFFSGKLSLMYYSPSLLRLAGSSISLNIDYLQKLKDSDISRALVPTYTGKNQFSISLGFQIFL
ncbi:hypothetical protein U0035_10170 [Niabella yanshanensis]|uniref:DUF6850 domain-containing protein n=1 Tax=Niabella yanshanensis TaxID=577386 RepID=A0ABZ0WCH8_9BACT|nr:DUF6850 family outer membrane beta-barrel protein [Niabella yanshanensis]WQD40513.1 hypothetical protein U0035_10170 [Niabella yanshanensis]